MIEKYSQFRKYPKPDVNNYLQDDVENIESAIDKIDADVNDLLKEVNEHEKFSDEQFKKVDTELGLIKETEAKNQNSNNTNFGQIDDHFLDVEKTIQGYWHPDANPFIYCRVKRYGYLAPWGGFHFTSQLQLDGPNVFKNLIGGHDNNYDVYAFPPSLQFVGKNARWLKSDGWLDYWNNANQYNYPPYDASVVFVENTTNSEIFTGFYRYMSANTYQPAYNGSRLYLGVPDKTNQEFSLIKEIAWSTLHNHTAASHNGTAGIDIIIPANKTVAIVFCSSAYTPFTNSNNHCGFIITHGIYSFDAFLKPGLLVDHKRTIKALQCRTQNIHEIWN